MTFPQQPVPQGQPQQLGHPGHDNKPRPEAVSYMLKLWLGALILEGVHLILSITMTLLNRDQLFAEARKTSEEAVKDSGQTISDELIKVVGYGSVAFSSMISLVIIVLLAVMLGFLFKNSKSAGAARRLWFAFSLYFGFRLALVFFTNPAGASIPDWLFVADGSVQILIGVAAALGLYFSIKEETLDYTGETEQLKKLQQEMAEQRREAEREQREKERQDSQGHNSPNSHDPRNQGNRR